jgi:hypothetical protein
MLGLTVRGLINLLNLGWHVEVERPTEEDKMERRSPSMSVWYLGSPDRISFQRKGDGDVEFGVVMDSKRDTPD